LPRTTDAANPADWLGFAEADLAAVAVLAATRTSFYVCRSQLAEAFEKALKADLVARGWPLAKVHDLQKLCDALAAYDPAAALRLQPTADDLAECYTEGRYPGFDLDNVEDWSGLEALLARVRSYVVELRERCGA
jgi:HEPN domain-containing protein